MTGGDSAAVLPRVWVRLRAVGAVAAAPEADRAACAGEQDEDDEGDPEACGAVSLVVGHQPTVSGTAQRWRVPYGRERGNKKEGWREEGGEEREEAR